MEIGTGTIHRARRRQLFDAGVRYGSRNDLKSVIFLADRQINRKVLPHNFSFYLKLAVAELFYWLVQT